MALPFYNQRTIGTDPRYYAQSNRGFVNGGQSAWDNPNQVTGQPVGPSQNVGDPWGGVNQGGNQGSPMQPSTGWSPADEWRNNSFQNTGQFNSGGTSYNTGVNSPLGGSSGGDGGDGWGSNQYAPGASITYPGGRKYDLNASWQDKAKNFLSGFSWDNITGREGMSDIAAGSAMPIVGMGRAAYHAYDADTRDSMDVPQPDTGEYPGGINYIGDDDPWGNTITNYDEDTGYATANDSGGDYWYDVNDQNSWGYLSGGASSGDYNSSSSTWDNWDTQQWEGYGEGWNNSDYDWI